MDQAGHIVHDRREVGVGGVITAQRENAKTMMGSARHTAELPGARQHGDVARTAQARSDVPAGQGAEVAGVSAGGRDVGGGPIIADERQTVSTARHRLRFPCGFWFWAE